MLTFTPVMKCTKTNHAKFELSLPYTTYFYLKTPQTPTQNSQAHAASVAESNRSSRQVNNNNNNNAELETQYLV